jgi:ubiquitin-protein ligase E3 A/E3 ubiquitin-protein ligase HERC4
MEDLKNGLQQLLDYEGDDVEDVFCLTLEVSWMDLGKEHKIELKPDGADIEVTQDNKEEYVMLYVKWILVDSIRPQREAFRKGVNVIMKGSSLGDLFTPQESGAHWLRGTQSLTSAPSNHKPEYEGGDDKESPVVQNLWKFVKNADHETQMHFLKFTTGTTKAPIGGLGAINFKVQRAGPELATTSHESHLFQYSDVA